MSMTETIRHAFEQLATAAITSLPRLLAGLAILVLGWMVARLLAAAARRLARRLGLDRAIERGGLAEGMARAGISRPGSELLARLLFWMILAGFAAVALENLGVSLSALPLAGLFAFLPRLVAALLVLVVGALLARLAGRATEAALAGLGVELHAALGRLVRGLLLVVVVVLAVDQVGFDIELLTATLTTLLAIAAAALALAFALGGRGVARNVLAGYYAREQLEPGDRVVIDGEEGTLESIGTISSEIAGAGHRWLVPNSRLTEEPIKLGGRAEKE